jgi:hypothetical protein
MSKSYFAYEKYYLYLPNLNNYYALIKSFISVFYNFYWKIFETKSAIDKKLFSFLLI